MIEHEKAPQHRMTVTGAGTRAVTAPPNTTSWILPSQPPGAAPPPAATTVSPVAPGADSLYWPPVACQGMGDWPFFGPDTERAMSRARRIVYAKAICASCPALLQCRVFALRTGQATGIWGGLSEEERGHATPVRVPPGRRDNPDVQRNRPAVVCHVR